MAAVVVRVVPVNVDFPAGPVTRESPIFLEANEPLVLATTPFIDWQPAPPAAAGGPPRVSLAHFLAVKHFASRCSTSRNPADLAAAAAAHPLVLRLGGAFWTRVLTELVPNGLLDHPFGSTSTLELAMSQLTITNPANLEVGAADWTLGQAFAIPGALFYNHEYLHRFSAFA